MREVTAMRQIESKNFISGLQAGEHNCSIGLRSAVRLHVGPCRTKELFKSLNSQRFNFIYKLTTTIVALAGQTFSVFIGKAAAHGIHHGL
jgi:hypothetical protein